MKKRTADAVLFFMRENPRFFSMSRKKERPFGRPKKVKTTS